MRSNAMSAAATAAFFVSVACLSFPVQAQGIGAVENFMGRVFGPPENGRTEPKRREPRKEKAEAPAGQETRAPGSTVESKPTLVPVPSPDLRPAQPDETAATPVPAPPTVSAKPDPATGNAAAEAPPPAEPVRPPPAETKAVEDIPVPEERPAEPGGQPSQPSGAKEEAQKEAEPAKPVDAPNATEKLKARTPTIDPATAVIAAAAVDDARECEAELKQRGAIFEVGPSISEGECGVLRPVAFGRSSSGIKVGPNTQMLCRTALALDIWLGDVVAPAAEKGFPDRKLTEFRQASTYVCRPRASETGISEHSRGSAIDIGAFVFDQGMEIGVAAHAKDSPEQRFMDTVRAGACGPFKTVLGPGTDSDHATHFHLDIAARKNGATYCK